MQKLDSLAMLPIWIDPEHLVQTALYVLQGHRLAVLPVVDSGKVLGYVSQSKLSAAKPSERVANFIEPFRVVFDGEMSIRQAATAFVKDDLQMAPVLAQGRLLGIVTSNLLLRELSRSWDPLTGLAWSERLREWSSEHLRHGREITMLFFDIDDFTFINKRYGHAVGDRTLQRVAAELAAGIDPSRDLLVRYGGDEFMIASLRSTEEAKSLSLQLKQAVESERAPDIEELLTCSVGSSGGKRQRRRENEHLNSMLEDLIRLAIADCQSKKRFTETPEAPVAAKVREPLIQVMSVQVVAGGGYQVILGVEDRVFGGADKGGEAIEPSVARATALAMESAFSSLRIEIEQVVTFEQPDGSQLVSISAQGTVDEKTLPISASAPIGDNPSESVAKALVSAIAASGLPLVRQSS